MLNPSKARSNRAISCVLNMMACAFPGLFRQLYGFVLAVDTEPPSFPPLRTPCLMLASSYNRLQNEKNDLKYICLLNVR